MATAAASTDYRKFREDFDKVACGRRGCSHAEELVSLRPACHPDAAVAAHYSFALQAVQIVCGVCGMGVCDVAVAARGAGGKRASTRPVRPTVVQRMDGAARRNRSRRK